MALPLPLFDAVPADWRRQRRAAILEATRDQEARRTLAGPGGGDLLQVEPGRDGDYHRLPIAPWWFGEYRVCKLGPNGSPTGRVQPGELVSVRHATPHLWGQLTNGSDLASLPEGTTAVVAWVAPPSLPGPRVPRRAHLLCDYCGGELVLDGRDRTPIELPCCQTRRPAEGRQEPAPRTARYVHKRYDGSERNGDLEMERYCCRHTPRALLAMLPSEEEELCQQAGDAPRDARPADADCKAEPNCP